MLGLLEHDVLSSIEVPYMETNSPPPEPGSIDAEEKEVNFISKADADQFDLDTFGFNYDIPETKAPSIPQRPSLEKRVSNRQSLLGAGSG